MGSTSRRLIRLALGVLLACVAIAVGLSVWRDHVIPSDAAELDRQLDEREREAQARERYAERQAQTQLELSRVADRLREAREAEQQDARPGSH